MPEVSLLDATSDGWCRNCPQPAQAHVGNRCPQPKTTRVDPCPRCGGNHARLEVRTFVQAPRTPDAPTAWAVCPETADPVLVRFEPENYCSDAL